MSSTKMEVDDSKMEIQFVLGRNKTIHLYGKYNFDETTTQSRIKFWEIIQEFAYQLIEELESNYSATVMKMSMFESDPGNIIFEIETDVSSDDRSKAIRAVQDRVNDELELTGEIYEPSPSVPIGGPDIPQ